MNLNPFSRQRGNLNALAAISAVSTMAIQRRTGGSQFKRGYAAAAINRLTADWKTESLSADGELRYTLRNMRARSRDLCMNNDYAKKFLRMATVNVVGPAGITLQNQAVEMVKDGKGGWKEAPDAAANRTIENAWWNWGKKNTACVNRKLSWLDVQNICLKSWLRDGEIFVRKIKGFDNPYGFATQMIEADYCDEEYNVDLGNGRTVRMGVELDEWEAPTAYYFLTRHPGDYVYGSAYTSQWAGKGMYRVRIPAEEIEHIFLMERPHQTRGIPEMYASMVRLNMLGAYEDAEVVGARWGASGMGFYEEKGEDDDDLHDAVEGEGTQEGALVSEMAPGTIEKLPPGLTFKESNPQHPSGNFGPFMKAMLRGISSGLCVSYNGLANDLEGVNYSSIRAGLLEERDMWKMMQNWYTEHFHDPIFPSWLSMALLTQKVPLPFAKFDKFNAAYWQSRGWDWVDPLKDQEANENSVRSGFKTRTQVCAERGLDFEEVCRQRAAEIETAKNYGLDFESAEQLKGAAAAEEGEVIPPDAKV